MGPYGGDCYGFVCVLFADCCYVLWLCVWFGVVSYLDVSAGGFYGALGCVV